MKEKQKAKTKKKMIIIIFIIILILCISIITLINNNNNNNKGLSIKEQLVGSWTSDEITIYKFNEDNTGILQLPLTNYPFTYKLEGNNIYIYFENEKSTDSSYEIKFEEDKLIFNGINQTVGIYTFTHDSFNND